jgi:hypothetical protein
LTKNNGIGSRTKHVDIRMRFLNDMVENGELELDHCPGNFITSDAITKNTQEAVRKVHADTMYNGLSCRQTTIDRTGRMPTLYWRCVTILCVRPIVGTTQRLTMTKRRESIVNVDVDVMGTDSCTMGTDSFRYPYLL